MQLKCLNVIGSEYPTQLPQQQTPRAKLGLGLYRVEAGLGTLGFMGLQMDFRPIGWVRGLES